MRRSDTTGHENSRELWVLPPVRTGSAGVSPARRRRSQSSNPIFGVGGSVSLAFCKVSLLTPAATGPLFLESSLLQPPGPTRASHGARQRVAPCPCPPYA